MLTRRNDSEPIQQTLHPMSAVDRLVTIIGDKESRLSFTCFFATRTRFAPTRSKLLRTLAPLMKRPKSAFR